MGITFKFVNNLWIIFSTIILKIFVDFWEFMQIVQIS